MDESNDLGYAFIAGAVVAVLVVIMVLMGFALVNGNTTYLDNGESWTLVCENQQPITMVEYTGKSLEVVTYYCSRDLADWE